MKRRYLVLVLIWVNVLTFSPVAPPIRAEEKEVMVENFTFKPKEVVISAGEKVIWIQKDRASHTVTANNGGFNSGRLIKGDEFTHTFSKKGSYDYVCKFHPAMRGKVIVK